jgi:O-antigen/teichoic acid export membrane protein
MNRFASRIPAVAGTIVARIVVLAAGLGASIVTARALGPGGRGQYYALTTVAATIAQFGNLGLSSSNTYLAARDRAASWSLVVNGLWICAAIAVIAVAVIAVTGEQLAVRLQVPRELLWAACLLGPAMLAFTFGSSVLVANERFGSLNGWQVLNALLAAGALGACAAMGAGVSTFVMATALAAIVTVGVLTVDLARGQRISLRFDISLFRRGMAFASRAYLALLIAFLLQRAAVTLLAAYRAPREIGFFSVAAQIYDVLVIFPTSVSMVLFPMLIRQRTETWATTRQVLMVTFCVMLVACVLAAILGRPLIPLVFGHAFTPSYAVMLWLLPGVILISIITILSQFLVADGFPAALVVNWVVGFGCCLAAGIPLTERFGAPGAAAAQSIGIAAVAIGATFLTAQRIRGAARREATACGS